MRPLRQLTDSRPLVRVEKIRWLDLQCCGWVFLQVRYVPSTMSKMIPKLIGAFFLSISAIAVATQQIPEVLLVDGEKFEIAETPLDGLHSFDSMQLIIQPEGWCSASWRGYKGFWELVNNKLYLSKIQISPCENSDTYLDASELIEREQYPIEATWVSGRITSPLGHMTGDEEMLPNGVTVLNNARQEIKYFIFNRGELIEEGTEIVHF